MCSLSGVVFVMNEEIVKPNKLEIPDVIVLDKQYTRTFYQEENFITKDIKDGGKKRSMRNQILF